jgi:hypothetical protein
MSTKTPTTTTSLKSFPTLYGPLGISTRRAFASLPWWQQGLEPTWSLGQQKVPAFEFEFEVH